MIRWNTTQAEDTQPGPYYVTAMKENGTSAWLMRGPFETHAQALDAVRETMDKACELDARAHWMVWGTCRMKDGSSAPGKMNQFFDL